MRKAEVEVVASARRALEAYEDRIAPASLEPASGRLR
jgi:hypothetical protein